MEPTTRPDRTDVGSPATLRLHEAAPLALELIVEQQGSVRVSVTGTSMLPTLWPGASVRVARAHAAQVERGDIVLLQLQGLPVLHRAVERGRDGAWLTRGDYCLASDPYDADARVLGRVDGVAVGPRVLYTELRAGVRLCNRAVLALLPAARPVTAVGVRVWRGARRLLRALTPLAG